MTQFTHIIKDEIGMHARPASLLAKEIKKSAQNMSLSGRVPLGRTGATYTQLPAETINKVPRFNVVVNSALPHILLIDKKGSLLSLLSNPLLRLATQVKIRNEQFRFLSH